MNNRERNLSASFIMGIAVGAMATLVVMPKRGYEIHDKMKDQLVGAKNRFAEMPKNKEGIKNEISEIVDKVSTKVKDRMSTKDNKSDAEISDSDNLPII